MSIIKLAIYGAIGYLVYETFFAEGAGKGGGGEIGNALRRGAREVGDALSGSRGGAQDHSMGGTRMTGGGPGRMEQTNEPSGESVSHRVGRGVI